jgi:NAD(P)-dependent dehydrogenase (short-subunit alcohol dehydrogenase family)
MTATFSGRVALVAGGTGGLGHAVSLAFLEEGASVIVTYRRQEEFDLLKGEAGGDGSRLDGQRADVTDEAAATELTNGVFARHGRLDVLVNAVADVKGTGVRVNSILPSIIDTEVNRRAMPKADFAKWPKPRDIARVILFLCSDDARVIHGAAIPVYGDS